MKQISFKDLLVSLPTISHPWSYGLLTYRSHVPDSSLSKRQSIDGSNSPGSITPHACPPSPSKERTCRRLSVCVPVQRGGVCMCEIGLARHGLRGFGKAMHLCVRVCMCVFVHVSVCSNFSPTGAEVTAVRKQIDFYPPTHKQLTTWCSIRHTMHDSLP